MDLNVESAVTANPQSTLDNELSVGTAVAYPMTSQLVCKGFTVFWAEHPTDLWHCFVSCAPSAHPHISETIEDLFLECFESPKTCKINFLILM